MLRQVVCEHPRIIINPSVGELLARYGAYYWRGRLYKYKPNRRDLYSFDGRRFSVKKFNITVDDVEECNVIDFASGELFPIYLLVPCGKCCLCKDAKANAFVERCKLETMCYTSKPWFVTLTYDEQHVPEDGLRVRDIQLFLKRFRINLQRAGFLFLIRYACVGEYGTKTHRPHYHILIWNVDSYNCIDYWSITRILRNSWGNGNIQIRLVDACNDKCFYYTAKYLRKDCKVPYYAVRTYKARQPRDFYRETPEVWMTEIKKKNAPFLLASRRGGGIGAHYLKYKVAPKIRKSLNPKFRILNIYTQQSEPLTFNSYVLNKLFPSFSRSVPSSFRKAVYQYFLDCKAFEYYENDDFFLIKFNRWNATLSKFLPCLSSELRPDEFPRDYHYNRIECLKRMKECEPVITAGLEKYDFEEARRLDDLRCAFLGKLDKLPQREVDIETKVYRHHWFAKIAESLEVF